MTDAQFLAWLESNDCRRLALVEVVARIAGVETTLYLASGNYVTDAGDTPVSTAYQACIVGGVRFTEDLSLSGQASIGWGDLELDNRDGSRDGWLDYVWTNRQIKIYMGDPRWDRADFRLIFDGVTGDIDTREASRLNLSLLDKLQRLNVPLTETTLGGSTNNKDRLIPLAFGECFNVEPLLTNPATLEYQVHSGAIEDIVEVNSGGAVPVAITETIATGKFTLSANPRNTAIRATIQGDKPATFSRNIAVLVKRICKDFGPTATRLVDADLDLTSLSAFEAAFTQAVGLYATERMNKLEACQQLAASVGAQVVMTTTGTLRLVQLTTSPAGTPKAVSARDMVRHSLRVTERARVRATCKLGFCRNWAPLEQCQDGVPPHSAVLYEQEWRTVTATDATTASVYKLDTEPVMEESLLLVEAEATTEAQRRRDLWKTQRQVYTADYFAHLLLTELGDPVTITHARFGMGAGKTGQAVHIERDWLRGRVTIGVLA